MAIYITGDTHGTHDVNKILKIKPFMRENDYLIVCGDFGICWNNGLDDRKVRNFWNRLKCHVLFVDGNHENFALLNNYPVTEKFGGKVHKLNNHITHMMRGQIFTLEYQTFFTMGGAASHDCGGSMNAIISEHLDDYYTHDFRADYDKLPRFIRRLSRMPGHSWWSEEIASPEEIAEAKANLAAHNNKIDYILTHSPSSIGYSHLGINPKEHAWSAPLTNFLDWIDGNVDFKKWYSGHMHEDLHYDEKHIGLYDDIRTIREID